MVAYTQQQKSAKKMYTPDEKITCVIIIGL